MRDEWPQIKKLQLRGDPNVFVVSAKKFIEKSFKSVGVNIRQLRDGSNADKRFARLPSKFAENRKAIFELIAALKETERPLDQYMGEFIDYAKILSEHDSNFDKVIELFKPES